MKSLTIIWLVVLAVIVGGGLYVNHAIGQMIGEMPDSHTSVLTPQSTLTVLNSDSSMLQPSQALYEDEYTPAMELQLTDYLQVSRHWAFLQDTNSIGGTQGNNSVIQAGVVR